MKNNTIYVHDVTIPIGTSSITGSLTLVKNSKNIIIFAHGSGSSRFSSRNIFVADILHKSQFSTLLFDLLTVEEEAIDERTLEYRFNIELLAERLILATQWIELNESTRNLKVGYFGASTGAAAALIAAAKLSNKISALVSRGGRPDLALSFLKSVTAPTLFIVGALDYNVIQLNILALEQLQCPKEMSVVKGASHLFEEPNTLEHAASIACKWFKKYME